MSNLVYFKPYVRCSLPTKICIEFPYCMLVEKFMESISLQFILLVILLRIIRGTVLSWRLQISNSQVLLLPLVTPGHVLKRCLPLVPRSQQID